MFEAPYPPYDPSDKTGFAFETVSERWPAILDATIDHLRKTVDQLSAKSQHVVLQDSLDTKDTSTRDKVQEGDDILEQIKRLKERMHEDCDMELIVEDGEAHVAVYNSELARLARVSKNTWFTAPWLFAECYLYRLLRSYFSVSRHWHSHDPFFAQKIETLKKSSKSIFEIAMTMRQMEHSIASLESDPAKIQLLFEDMVQMSLWGNTADLSLFVNLSSSDIQSLQFKGSKDNFFLRNDQKEIWKFLKNMTSERIDIVLDNAGFELFTDLVFADFLVTFTPHVSRVVFHPKLIPWFVSDVTPTDFKATIASLLDKSVFPPPPPALSSYNMAWQALEHMVTRWKMHLDNKVFTLAVSEDTPLGGDDSEECEMASFWTSPWPYWDMQTQANGLWNWLRRSGMVIFKGDLNYRKLTGDVQWPVSTPFSGAVGPLAGSFSLVSLCFSKSDVIAGVKDEMAKDLDHRESRWRVNGKFALVSFVPPRHE